MYKCVVIECEVRHRLFKGISCAYTGGVATLVDECMSVLFNLYVVLANGHADFKTAIFVGLNQFPFHCADVVIDVQVATLYRVSGILVIYYTAYGETADIVETDIAVCQ